MIFHTNIENDTLENNNYRKVISTQSNMQIVLMSLKPKEEIGNEIHENIDQFFRVEKGKAKAIITDNKTNEVKEYELKDGSVLIIPKGTYHNIINIGDTELKLYTIYSPPNHNSDLVQLNKPNQEGGYYEKYLKYKIKYLKLLK
jgi:mannose-6-phosphate isomerase-like protein (cupin superfamily)